jgi:hypothetical protein
MVALNARSWMSSIRTLGKNVADKRNAKIARIVSVMTYMRRSAMRAK